VIPDEAVEAAAKALRDAFDWGVDCFEKQAKRALEAAAPYLQSAAWQRGVEDGYHHRPNPYIKQQGTK